MRVHISDGEWRAVLARVRDVGGGFGGTAGEGAAIVVARVALETIGVSVPVIVDELDVSSPSPTPAGGVYTGPRGVVAAGSTGAGGIPDAPARDLRRSVRTAEGGRDGYCDHCGVVYGAAALATVPDGNRLCPVHGVAVTEISEVAEGRYATTRPTAAGAHPDAHLCGAPIGGSSCARPLGHTGRHNPRAES